jgi:hypothetical protein
MKNYVRILVLVGSLFAITLPTAAQEIVHALIGTVSGIDPSNKTITVFQNGTRSTFRAMTSSKTQISFSKRFAEASIPATLFQKQGSCVVVFYYGMDQNRTAVALKDLGQGPFSSTIGKVSGWDGHTHTLFVTGPDGKHSFKEDSDTVAETYAGAVGGADFHAESGEYVRVVSAMKNGSPTALFVTTM